MFVFSIISQHEDVSGTWNHSLWETRSCLSYIVNTIAADGRVIQQAISIHVIDLVT